MMRLPRGLSGRVLIASAACAGLSTALVMSVIMYLLVDQFLTRVAFIVPQLDPFLRQQCEHLNEQVSSLATQVASLKA